MKNKTLLLASICWGIVLAMVPAYAQSGAVQVKVPFDFTIGGKTFPAGDYRINSELHQLRIQDSQGRNVALALTNDASGAPRDNASVVFNCYDHRCFLSEVWSPAQDSGAEVYKSKAEADLQKELAGRPSQY
jgi:hypothetical protein